MAHLPPGGVKPARVPVSVPTPRRTSDSPDVPAESKQAASTQAADGLGFPPRDTAAGTTTVTGTEPLSEAAAGPLVEDTPALANRATHQTRFEDLPLALVTHIVVAYLGRTGFEQIRGLIQLNPLIASLVDPGYEVLATLEPSMRVIALRQMLLDGAQKLQEAADAISEKRPPRSRSDESQLRDLDRLHRVGYKKYIGLAIQEEAVLKAETSIALVDFLVQRNVEGVLPVHRDLLGVLNGVLAGCAPGAIDVNGLCRAARACFMDEHYCRNVLTPLIGKAPEQLSVNQISSVKSLRTAVLTNAFKYIATSFAQEAGWTAPALEQEVVPGTAAARGTTFTSSNSGSSTSSSSSSSSSGRSSGGR